MRPVFADAREARAVEACRAGTAARAVSFHRAMRLTPEPGFSALCVVYAWMAAADDLADAPAPGSEIVHGGGTGGSGGSSGGTGGSSGGADRVAAAEAFWARTEAVLDGRGPGPGDPADLWVALRWVARGFGLPRAALRGVVDGQLADLAFTQPVTEAQLDAYCHRVASTVGRVCVALWGGDPARTDALADARGVALQRTNILRDVAEDAARGRVYLPAEALARHGVAPADLAALPADDAARARVSRLLRGQVALARGWYGRSAGLEARLPRRGRASSAAIGGVYRVLLERIAADPLAVLEGRVRPGRPARLGAVARALGSSRLPAGWLRPL